MRNIKCKVSDNILIELCGEDRFTNKNTHYAIKLIAK